MASWIVLGVIVLLVLWAIATYNGLGAVTALIIPGFVKRLGIRRAHQVNLWIGAAGLLSMMLIRDPRWLLASMVGLGFAWGSIISLPYAMLANNLPAQKMGVNMGIFNIFIVIPQLVIASLTRVLLEHVLHGRPIYMLAVGGVSFIIAAICALRVGNR